uniref:Uncharacterized protein n=1 Tax=Oryzias latipes TaxID=8090 RepID=A0A3P9LMG6_ORYLA
MIQSSQPISLKLTCRCFLWQRCLGFPCWFLVKDGMGSSRTLFVPLAAGARLIRRWVNRSRLLLLPKAKRKAFSLFVLPRRENPKVRRSMGRPLRCSSASNSKQSCWEKILLMSNTSHLLLSVLNQSSVLFTWRDWLFPPPSPAVEPLEAMRGSDIGFLRIRSSAPRSPSSSKELMGPWSSGIEKGTWT